MSSGRYRLAVSTWYDYRAVWSRHPWLLILAVAGVAMVLLGIVGSIAGTLAAVLFVPGLLLLFAHHVLVQRRT